jgi:hypothetical protein
MVRFSEANAAFGTSRECCFISMAFIGFITVVRVGGMKPEIQG